MATTSSSLDSRTGRKTKVSTARATAFVEAFDALVRAVIVPNSHKSAHALALGPQDVRAVTWLGQRRECLMSEFAKGVGVPLSTATHLANRLVEKGMLSRERVDEDRRTVYVTLTAAGRKLNQELFAGRLNTSLHLLAKLNKEEQQKLVALLQKALFTPNTEAAND
jgi:DNA-binding MarR family transcriptional regulator